jgi:hypothetical protein
LGESFLYFFALLASMMRDDGPLSPHLHPSFPTHSDGAANAPSIVGVCQPVGGAVEAVAACFWRLVPGKKGAPKYHIDF